MDNGYAGLPIYYTIIYTKRAITMDSNVHCALVGLVSLDFKKILQLKTAFLFFYEEISLVCTLISYDYLGPVM